MGVCYPLDWHTLSLECPGSVEKSDWSGNAVKPRAGKTSGLLLKRARKLRRPLFAFLGVILLLAAYNVLVSILVTQWEQKAPRDPDSGILIGAEPIDLGPKDARTAVLLVHGFAGAGNNFGELPQRLAEAGYRVRAMLLPGHGTSPRDFAKTSHAALLQAVLDELRSLKERHETLFLAGHSMGGALSTLAASIEEVDGLILAAPYFGVTYHWYYVLPAETWTGLTGPFVRWIYKGDAFICVKRTEVSDQIFSYRWIPASASATLVRLGRLAKDPDVLAGITCPVLLLHGHDDRAASPAAAAAVFEAMASENKQAVWLDNSDHHIFWDYDRERAITEILRFTAEISGS